MSSWGANDEDTRHVTTNIVMFYLKISVLDVFIQITRVYGHREHGKKSGERRHGLQLVLLYRCEENKITN